MEHHMAVPRVGEYPIAFGKRQRRLGGNRHRFRTTWNIYRRPNRPPQLQIFGRLFQDRRGDARGTKSESRLQCTVAKAVYQAWDSVGIVEDETDHVARIGGGSVRG